ncbi:phage infection protein [Kroppenstedtia guangzhouensis]|uniref:Phage infection protein n=1 Tax=Kroppenstedtia guangzhouensis TaxID=1274356 RepID=A0ABQ1H141_9BACL|nr:YhgE/Pip domain-containing protein [Kroppenstedtia guangzhouensis]GGA54258.1 phage infection protein [Kroppenstedtia guangzhouensis]
MKNILSIYARDLKNITRHWVAAVIIGGLILLPSLYAWFNIKASWDPYGNTQGVPVAVTNLDKGTTVRGHEIRLGDEVVRSLKKNKKLGWIFINQKKAYEGVRRGDVYASITIPEDFSKKIATVITGEPVKPEIVYYVNEKINAIAPKMTEKGATGIVQQVSDNFVKTATGAMFKTFNELGIELEREWPTVKALEELVFRLEKSFPTVNRAVRIALEDVNKAAEITGKAQRGLARAARITRDGKEFTHRLHRFLDHLRGSTETLLPRVKDRIETVHQTAVSMQQLTSRLQKTDMDPTDVKSAVSEATGRLTAGLTATDHIIQLLERVNRLADQPILDPEIKRLQRIREGFQQQLMLLDRIESTVSNGEAPGKDLFRRWNDASRITQQRTQDVMNRLEGEFQPKIRKGLDQADSSLDRVQSILDETDRTLPDVNKIIRDATKGIAVGKKELRTIKEHLPQIEAKVHHLADEIRKAEAETDLGEVIDLLKNDFHKESDFFAQPVLLREVKLYPIPNYGSAMSPFYTVLSLWVGTLLLVSLLTTEVHDPHGVYKSYQVYFGRYLTFLTIALMQSVIVTVGNLFVLHTYCSDPLWFVLFGLLISAVSMLIVYTLVSVFGNVGKALSIVLLVLQLSASGGTFPVQVMPLFFQAIHPFLPFTYAISMMREAVGGAIWEIVWKDLSILGVFAALALLIGLALKEPINRKTSKLMESAKASQLIH